MMDETAESSLNNRSNIVEPEGWEANVNPMDDGQLSDRQASQSQTSHNSRSLSMSAASPHVEEARSPGYYEEGNNFGVVKKGKYKAASDFRFEFVAEVICEDPHSSGFMVQLTPDRPEGASQEYEADGSARRCYFTSESTNRKTDFMREIGSSYKIACLQCSFSDKELSEFIQLKKRKSQPIPVKYAVSHVGRHADGTWVLGNNAYFTDDGTPITLEDSKYVWIGDIFEGRGVAKDADRCKISYPLSTDCLRNMLVLLKRTMAHNFYPTVMTIAGTIMALHFTRFMKTIRSCPITLAYGSSGTGKTSAVHCGLSLIGADDHRFYRDVTPAMVTQLCSVTNIPLGVDDPDSKSMFSKVIMDVYGGAKKGTISRGETRPISTVVISSNFPTVDQQRYSSRCMMIEFSEPPIQLTLTDYMNLVDLWKSAGSCAGFCISLGHLFFTEGVSQVDDVIQPLLSSSFAHANTLSPRVLPSYSILYWFALKVLEEGGMPVQNAQSNDLLQYFSDVVLVTAARLQSWTTGPKQVSNEQTTCEGFGNELLRCISGLLPQEIGCFLKVGSYLKIPVFNVKLDRVPGLSCESKANVRKWLQRNSHMGAHNVPRRFNNDTKCVKCTVISPTAFSNQLQDAITAAMSGAGSQLSSSPSVTPCSVTKVQENKPQENHTLGNNLNDDLTPEPTLDPTVEDDPPGENPTIESRPLEKKRYLTRSKSEAPPFSKRLCKGDSLYHT